MPTTRYMDRLEHVLEARLEDKRRAQRPVARRLVRVLTALVMASLCFLVLKGATLAYLGVERLDTPAIAPGIERAMAPATAPVTAPAQADGLRLWLVGPDPVSRVVAQAFRGAAVPEPGLPAD